VSCKNVGCVCGCSVVLAVSGVAACVSAVGGAAHGFGGGGNDASCWSRGVTVGGDV